MPNIVRVNGPVLATRCFITSIAETPQSTYVRHNAGETILWSLLALLVDGVPAKFIAYSGQQLGGEVGFALL